MTDVFHWKGKVSHWEERMNVSAIRIEMLYYLARWYLEVTSLNLHGRLPLIFQQQSYCIDKIKPFRMVRWNIWVEKKLEACHLFSWIRPSIFRMSEWFLGGFQIFVIVGDSGGRCGGPGTAGSWFHYQCQSRQWVEQLTPSWRLPLLGFEQDWAGVIYGNIRAEINMAYLLPFATPLRARHFHLEPLSRVGSRSQITLRVWPEVES